MGLDARGSWGLFEKKFSLTQKSSGLDGVPGCILVDWMGSRGEGSGSCRDTGTHEPASAW